MEGNEWRVKKKGREYYPNICLVYNLKIHM